MGAVPGSVSQRVAAYIIDHFLAGILGPLSMILVLRVFMDLGLYAVVGLVFPGTEQGPPFNVPDLWANSYSLLVQLRVLAVFLLLPRWAYMTLFHGSRWQATPGKMLLGLKVVNRQGSPPGYFTAALRSLIRGVLFTVTVGLSGLVNLYLLSRAPKRQTLHDLIAGTEVVRALRG